MTHILNLTSILKSSARNLKKFIKFDDPTPNKSLQGSSLLLGDQPMNIYL